MTTTTNSPDAVDFGCPSWCSSDHAVEWLKPGDEPFHRGPSFGPHVSVSRYGGVTAASLSDLATDDMTPADLRQLAKHAQRAALWIESHR